MSCPVCDKLREEISDLEIQLKNMTYQRDQLITANASAVRRGVPLRSQQQGKKKR